MCYSGKCYYEDHMGDCRAPKDLFFNIGSSDFINEKKEEALSHALCIIVENADVNQFYMLRCEQIYGEN